MRRASCGTSSATSGWSRTRSSAPARATATFLTGPRAAVRLQQPLGPWGAWYGAPIAVATTDVGYALVWQTAEDLGGGGSGFNDYLLTAEFGVPRLPCASALV